MAPTPGFTPPSRRDSARVLLTRLANGKTLTPAEVGLLTAHYEAECAFADQLPARRTNVHAGRPPA